MGNMPNRKRRWYQFRLSTLFGVTLLVAIWAFWTGFLIRALGDATNVPKRAWIEMTGGTILTICLYVRATARNEDRRNRR
jgi:hypothetical protein